MSLSPEERAALVERTPKRPEDLLTDEQKERLNADLAEGARLRRRAFDSARDWPMS